MLHQTDRWVLVACILTGVFWSLNAFVSSTALLYVNLLMVVGIFGYTLWKADPDHELRQAWLVGMVACVVYAYIDSLLASFRFGLITYLKTNDWRPFGEAPLVLILLWGCFITIALYFYQRVRHSWSHAYPAMLATAAMVLIANLGLEWLGETARLWNWNAQRVPSGYILGTPVFVPISYALAFLFSPYILKNPFIGGLRCGIVLGCVRFCGFAFIRYLVGPGM